MMFICAIVTLPSNDLTRLCEQLPVPDDYFVGLESGGLVIPRNILAFMRKTPEDLHQPAMENKSHHRYVLAVPLEGEGKVSLDDAVYPLAPGGGLLFFPYQFHYYLDATPGQIACASSNSPGNSRSSRFK